MLFLKNSHTNNLITPVLGFRQQAYSARGPVGGKALHAHSQGTAVRRREMVFNSLWNIQQWLRCTFQSLLIVKPTENNPSCVLRAASPQLVSPFGGLRSLCQPQHVDTVGSVKGRSFQKCSKRGSSCSATLGVPQGWLAGE